MEIWLNISQKIKNRLSSLKKQKNHKYFNQEKSDKGQIHKKNSNKTWNEKGMALPDTIVINSKIIF